MPEGRSVAQRIRVLDRIPGHQSGFQSPGPTVERHNSWVITRCTLRDHTQRNGHSSGYYRVLYGPLLQRPRRVVALLPCGAISGGERALKLVKGRKLDSLFQPRISHRNPFICCDGSSDEWYRIHFRAVRPSAACRNPFASRSDDPGWNGWAILVPTWAARNARIIKLAR